MMIDGWYAISPLKYHTHYTKTFVHYIYCTLNTAAEVILQNEDAAFASQNAKNMLLLLCSLPSSDVIKRVTTMAMKPV